MPSLTVGAKPPNVAITVEVSPDIVSLGVSADMLALVDAKARRLGVGRDDVIRHAIARDLVDA